MKGRSEAQRRRDERDLILAYNTGAFSRASGKSVRPLAYYLRQMRGDKAGHLDALRYFRSLKARGADVSIQRVSRSVN